MKKTLLAAAVLFVFAALIGILASKSIIVSGSAGFQSNFQKTVSKALNHSASPGEVSGNSFHSASPGEVSGDSFHSASSEKAPKASFDLAASEASFHSASSDALPLLCCKYYNEKGFMASTASAEASAGGRDAAGTAKRGAAAGSGGGSTSAVPTRSGAGNGGVVGGIVPHHLLAGKMIASFFRNLSAAEPRTIVILAPNHNRIGHSGLQISPFDWGTAFGVLKADRKLAGQLLPDDQAAVSSEGPSGFAGASLMEKEHSVSALIPYIKYYMPEVKVVPVLLHGNIQAEAAEEFGRSLAAECLTPGTAIIASVDFSHYLSAADARKMDEKTLKAISSADLKAISQMGNDNLDSPPAIIALISAMKELEASAPEVTGHDNSSDITGSGADYTTSYFTMLYRRPAN